MKVKLGLSTQPLQFTTVNLEEEVNILRSVRPGKQAAYYFGQILKRHYKQTMAGISRSLILSFATGFIECGESSWLLTSEYQEALIFFRERRHGET